MNAGYVVDCQKHLASSCISVYSFPKKEKETDRERDRQTDRHTEEKERSTKKDSPLKDKELTMQETN